MPRISPTQAGGINRCAFLDMIGFSEIGAQLLAASDDGYNVLVGSIAAAPNLFHDYSQHPNILVTVRQNPLLQSTAAGRYQLLHRYWPPYQEQLKLPDFGPVSQDLIAIEQIRECQALPDIDAGKFAAAVALCAHIWASLPGNDYEQHQNELVDLQAAYQRAGGIVLDG